MIERLSTKDSNSPRDFWHLAKNISAAMIQWNHACFGVQGVSKRTGSNPVQGPSVGWASSLGATVS
ncbi:hypothetical protein E2C01_030967 [Portunus trituberculatus]|uniref:Uncharacterized protein n=1 Tax=Portunus trituberculatus TaxID=210409 RepID=A0A5B7EWC2_PORTR|nr:hypothetical protein [Portunus trituberculatus]